MSYNPETHENNTRSAFYFFYNGTAMSNINTSVVITLDTSGIDSAWTITNNQLDDLINVDNNEKVIGKSDVVFTANNPGDPYEIMLSTYSAGNLAPPGSQGYPTSSYLCFQDRPDRTSYHASHTDECLNIFGKSSINIHTYETPNFNANCDIAKGKSIVAGCVI